MNGFFRLVARVVVLVLIAVSVGFLVQAERRDSLLGMWDGGRFSGRVMPEPARIPDEQLARLRLHRRIQFQAEATHKEGDNLADLFHWYDLDKRYVDETVNKSRIDPTHVPTDPFDVVLLNEN